MSVIKLFDAYKGHDGTKYIVLQNYKDTAWTVGIYTTDSCGEYFTDIYNNEHFREPLSSFLKNLTKIGEGWSFSPDGINPIMEQSQCQPRLRFKNDSASASMKPIRKRSGYGFT